MNVYVVDAYGLSELGVLVAADRLNDVLHELVDLVKSGHLRFPDAVWRELCQFPDEFGIALWAKAVAGHLSKDSSTYEHEDMVLNAAQGLVDPNSTEYQTQVDVAKMAVWLNHSHGVVVVTEDVIDRPDRTALQGACAALGLASISLAEFLDGAVASPYS